MSEGPKIKSVFMNFPKKTFILATRLFRRVVRMLDHRETALNQPFLAKLVGVGCFNVKYLFDSSGTSPIN